MKKMKNNTFEEIRQAISNSQRIAVSGHTSPDADAIGSSCALALAIQQMGKDVFVFLEKYPDKFKIIPGGELVVYEDYNDVNVDLFIALDCGDKERLGQAAVLFDKVPNICIDHHISNTYFAHLNYVDSKASSTAEIIYQLLDGYWPLDSNIASALYTGILFDTGCFKHDSTTPRTMEIVAKLMTYHVPFTKIQEKLFYTHTFAEVRMMGKVLERANLVFDNKVAYSYITLEEVRSYGGTTKELDHIVSELKTIKGTDIAVFFYEKEPNVIKTSLRADNDSDVCQIALAFGGGGHIKAAGCTILDTMENAIAQVLKEIEKQRNKGA